MDDERQGKPVKVKFSDKRRASRGDRGSAPGGASPEASPLRSATEEVAGTADSSSASRPQGTAPSSPNPSLEGDSNSENPSSAGASDASSSLVEEEETERQGKVPAETRTDYLEDLRRVQADFDNYRKRVLREQTQLASRASARLVERMLPVLDNFEAAISHGEGGDGVQLVYKELRRVLEEEGLEEIAAEGQPFDPHLHEAFQAIEDPEVGEPMVHSVMRRGYSVKGQVIRPSMVSVARPPDVVAQADESEESTGEDAAEG